MSCRRCCRQQCTCGASAWALFFGFCAFLVLLWALVAVAVVVGTYIAIRWLWWRYGPNHGQPLAPPDPPPAVWRGYTTPLDDAVL